jgi:hypothetical protein
MTGNRHGDTRSAGGGESALRGLEEHQREVAVRGEHLDEDA